MTEHKHIGSAELWRKMYRKDITFGGNKLLKIYGSLRCRSGKRMKRENRVFFASAKEAADAGYRPCGHCMKQEYHDWKHTHGSI